MLAPRTLHTEASQRAGPGTVRTGGTRVVCRVGGVKDVRRPLRLARPIVIRLRRRLAGHWDDLILPTADAATPSCSADPVGARSQPFRLSAAKCFQLIGPGALRG